MRACPSLVNCQHSCLRYEYDYNLQEETPLVLCRVPLMEKMRSEVTIMRPLLLT